MFNFYIDDNTKKADKKDLRRLILSLFIRKMILLIKLIIDPLKLIIDPLYDQIYEYIESILPKVQCGFRKYFSTQYSLTAMIEIWRKIMDKGKLCAALLTDLSKDFDSVVHDFLIAQLEAYGFSYESLKAMYNYLTDMKHRNKVNNFFTDFYDLLLGVPQGSNLGPLLFNIYICIFSFLLQKIMLLAIMMRQLHIQTVKMLQQF